MSRFVSSLHKQPLSSPRIGHLASLLGVLLLILSAWGCTTPPVAAPTMPPEVKNPPAEPTEQVFRMALSSRPRSLDPALVTETGSVQLVLNTFEGLMIYGKTSGPTKYGTAESHTLSEDGKVYTFKIRKNAKRSDGASVTAKDFEYAWKRALYPSTASEYAWLITDVAQLKGASEYNMGRGNHDAVGIKALDDHTLEITLDIPVPFFLDLMAFSTFAPIPSAQDEAGTQWNEPEEWISNGAFVFTGESSSRRYVMERNKHYWDAQKVALDRVEIEVIPDGQERLAVFKAGDLDWTGSQDLPLSQIEAVSTMGEYHQDSSLSVSYLVFNTQIKPLDDLRVRQAISLAIDRDEIVIKQFKGAAQAAYGFVPPMPGFSTWVRRKTDLKRAKELFTEAGFPNGEGFPTLTYLYPDNSNANATATQLAGQLKALGVTLALESRPFNELLNAAREGEFQLLRSAWVADFADPVSFLGLWEGSSQHNKAKWKNQDYDRLLDEAAKATELTKRYALYEEAELLLDQQSPITPLYYTSQTYLLGADIEGFGAHKLNVHLLKYIEKVQR